MSRKWTLEEINYLEESVGRTKISTIADKLNRTENAILLKLKRLGIANTKNQTGLLTVSELAKLIHVDCNTVKGWIKNHKLKCSFKTTRSARKFWFVCPEDFWEWAKGNKEKVNFSRIDYQSIIPEPCWVETERKRKQETIISYRNWTTVEERLLLQLVEKGNSFDEIGKRLDRSKLSLKRKLDRLIV